MSQIICHHDGKYNLYSTVSDGFCYVSALTLDQIKSLTKEEYGNHGMKELIKRLDRAHSTGCSMHNETLEELLICNRAGKNEKYLTFDECIKEFFEFA